jgi:hypothetical protein
VARWSVGGCPQLRFPQCWFQLRSMDREMAPQRSADIQYVFLRIKTVAGPSPKFSLDESLAKSQAPAGSDRPSGDLPTLFPHPADGRLWRARSLRRLSAVHPPRRLPLRDHAVEDVAAASPCS